MICVITIGNVAAETSFKENVIRKAAHGKIKELTHFYSSDSTSVPEWFLTAVKAVQLAPSAVNKQKYLFEYKQEQIKAVTNNEGTYAFVDLGIAKAHFVIAAGGKFQWGNNADYIRN